MAPALFNLVILFARSDPRGEEIGRARINTQGAGAKSAFSQEFEVDLTEFLRSYCVGRRIRVPNRPNG